jgi:hypothetical protein
MDTKQFKKLIKEAVKEAIQEELREILLEAVKAPKATIVTENSNNYTAPTSPNKTLTPSERRAMFGNILEDMQTGIPANTNNIPFRPTPGIDTINGALPAGELGLDQIMNLMVK